MAALCGSGLSRSAFKFIQSRYHPTSKEFPRVFRQFLLPHCPYIVRLSHAFGLRGSRTLSSFRCSTTKSSRSRPTSTHRLSSRGSDSELFTYTTPRFVAMYTYLDSSGSSRRKISTFGSKRTATHYYDVLELSPNATQSQIKSAYYKKSKLCHPDVATDGKSHALFAEISEAYEVLGNLRKRRMYDKGIGRLRDRSDHQHSDHPGDYTKRYQQSSNFERGSRPPPPTGRSRIYNFDEFYQQHYNDVRERRGREHKAYTRHREMMEERARMKGVQIPFIVAFPLWLVALLVFVVLFENHDQDLVGSNVRTSSGYDSLGKISEPKSR